MLGRVGVGRPTAGVEAASEAPPGQARIFAVPDATDPAATVETILAVDRSGLDLVGVQDHPYQRRFFATWTLLSYAAGRTERVRLLPDVINLPLYMSADDAPRMHAAGLGEDVAPRVRELVPG